MEPSHGDEHAYTLGRIKQIRLIHKREITTAEEAAKSLREEAEILKDILPGYKIKEMTEEDKSQMRSKEVRALQNVEQTILSYYRKFIGNVLALAHKKNADIQHMAVACLCDLLPVAQDFNFGSSLIDVVVHKANSRDPRISSMCIAAVRDVLSAPVPTDAVLSCLQCISDAAKELGPKVNPRLITSLLFLRIRSLDVHARDIKEAKKEKQRRKKEDKELTKKLSKADASISRVQQAQLQTKVLNKLITTYLRVMDTCRTTTSPYVQSLLLAPTMEGLAKFAHLIDFSLFDLLLKAIEDALDSPTTTTAATLNGIITVATMANQMQKVSSSGDGIAVDIAPYYEKLYKMAAAALEVATHNDERSRIFEDKETTQGEQDDTASVATTLAPGGRTGHRNTLRERTERAVLLLKACSLLLLQPKKVPLARAAAFYRRLQLSSVHQPPHIAAGLLAFCHRLVQKYPQMFNILDGDEVPAGKFDPQTDSPDHVNALASSAWEIPLLRRSFHPMVSQFTAALLKEHRGTASGKSKAVAPYIHGFDFDKGVRQFDNSGGGFNPPPASTNKKLVAGRKKATQAAMREALEEVVGEPSVVPPKKKAKRS